MEPRNNDSENEEEDESVQLSDNEVELGDAHPNKDGISINPITGMINMTNLVATGIG